MVLFKKINNFFERKKSNELQSEVFNPEIKVNEEIINQTATLTLFEQLRMINIIDEYFDQYEKDKIRIDPKWERGFFIECEATITDMDQQLYKSNVEVFYKEPQTIEKKYSFLVSLVKFPEDTWRVLQVKQLENY